MRASVERIAKVTMVPSAIVVVSCILASWVVQARAQRDPKIEYVVRSQEEYFNSLRSLEFNSTMVLRLTPQLVAKHELKTNVLKHRMRFVMDGEKYLSEVHYLDFSTGEMVTTTRAYDGELYQLFQDSDPEILTVSRTKAIDNLYGGIHPLVTAFRFAFWPGDKLSVFELKSRQKWERFGAMVRAHTDVNMFGHSGVKVFLTVPSMCSRGTDTYEVFFAADLAGLPISWKAVHPDGSVSKARVVATESFAVENEAVTIPSRIEFADYFEAGVLGQEGYIEIAPTTLRVNQPVEPTVFRISMSKAKIYVDEDTARISRRDEDGFSDAEP